MIAYILITVGDMKTKLFLLKTNVLKFTLQKFERKNQRNKCFVKLFTNVRCEPLVTWDTSKLYFISCQTQTNISASMAIKASVIRVFRSSTDIGRGGT